MFKSPRNNFLMGLFVLLLSLALFYQDALAAVTRVEIISPKNVSPLYLQPGQAFSVNYSVEVDSAGSYICDLLLWPNIGSHNCTQTFSVGVNNRTYNGTAPGTEGPNYIQLTVGSSSVTEVDSIIVDGTNPVVSNVAPTTGDFIKGERLVLFPGLLLIQI